MAGGHKHKWTKLLKTDYFGKNGFVPVTRNEVREANLITVSQLAEKTGDSVVNLAEAGYDKLLASGRIFKPLTVVVSRWTKRAEEKIRSVGGRIVKPGELVTA